MLQVISLGAGVQSTTMALMAAAGEITPLPDAAIFADTGWEPKAVYVHLERLMAALPFPVHIVSAGNIRKDILARSNSTGGRYAAVPWYIRLPNGGKAMGRRQCTKEYKLRPIQRQIVALHGGKRPKGGTRLWLGISTDEAYRMKPSWVQYIDNCWPLIDKRMDRNDCQTWLAKRGWSAPKSSCIGCPYRSNAHWRELTADEFADAVEVDQAIRRQSGFKGEQFVHRTFQPLDQVDFRTASEKGQLDLFLNECEGLCGV